MTVYTEIWQGENFESFAQEVIDICGEWWKDTIFHTKLNMEYVPDISQFKVVSEYGNLVAICLRDNELNNKLVGLYLGVIHKHLFNKDIVQLSEVVWCVTKTHRKAGLAALLLKRVQEYISMSDVINMCSLSSPNHMQHTSLDLFIERKGFIMADKIYYKRI